MLSGRLFALLCLLQLQKVFLFGFLEIFNQKDERLEVWDIAKQNMDPIFRLDIDQSEQKNHLLPCLLYTSPSPRDLSTSRMPSSA